MKVLTIAVPAYNVEKYLDRCLSTLVSHKQVDDLEIIVINDGSTDHTLDIARKYQNAHGNTVFVINKTNGGHGSAVNAAIANSHGIYFMIVDGDDWVKSQSLAILIKQLKVTSADLVSVNYYRVNMNSGESEAVCQQGIKYNKIFTFEALNVSHIYFALASSVFRTDILKRHSIVLQENTYYVDVEYMLMPIPYVKTVLFLDLYVYRYFVGNTHQSVHIPNLVKRYPHHDRVLKRIIIYLYSEADWMTKKHKEYINNILLQLINTHYSISLIYNENKIGGFKEAKKFDDFLKINSPELYLLSNNKFYYLRLYRKNSFNYKKVCFSPAYILKNTFIYAMIKKVYYKLNLSLLVNKH